MRIYRHISLVALAGLLAWSGCDSTGPGTSRAPGKTVALGGTVVFRDNGTGFYGILADNGGQYEPENLDARYEHDGNHIIFTGTLDTTKLGAHDWGNPIELTEVSEEQ